MDGLDAEEVHSLRTLKTHSHLGAEYYGKVYVRTAETIKRLNHVTLQGMSKLITRSGTTARPIIRSPEFFIC